jgi:hypothetical protein
VLAPRQKHTTAKARLFIKSLLAREAGARLGSNLDYAKVRAHAFFEQINWAQLTARTLPSPFTASSPAGTLI